MSSFITCAVNLPTVMFEDFALEGESPADFVNRCLKIAEWGFNKAAEEMFILTDSEGSVLIPPSPN